jgi:hypothetical protein
MEKFFAQHGIHMTTGMEVSSDEAIKQSVQAGLGLGIMSRDAIQNEISLGHLIMPDVLHFPIMRQWYVMHRKGKRLSPIALAFKTFLLKEAAQILKKDSAPTTKPTPPAALAQTPPEPLQAPQASRRYEPAKTKTVLIGADGKPIPPAPSKS